MLHYFVKGVVELDDKRNANLSFIDALYISSFITTLIIISLTDMSKNETFISFFALTFPYQGLLNIWPVLEVSKTGIKFAFLYNFISAIAWWSGCLYYTNKYRILKNRLIVIVIMLFLLTLIWLICLQTFTFFNFKNNYENCLYTYYYNEKNCWDPVIVNNNITWTKVKDSHCNVKAVSIAAYFWASLLGGFSSIPLMLDYYAYKQICHDLYHYSLGPFYLSFFYFSIWMIIYFAIIVYYILKLRKRKYDKINDKKVNNYSTINIEIIEL